MHPVSGAPVRGVSLTDCPRWHPWPPVRATGCGGSMKHAVVTGGAGFLGSHLCSRLLDDGYRVTCLDNFLTGSPANVAHLIPYSDFRCVQCDITNYVHVSGPVDLVLHFAS